MRLKRIQPKEAPTEFERMVSDWSEWRLAFEIWLIDNKASEYSRRQRERIVDLGIKIKVKPYAPPKAGEPGLHPIIII